MCSSMTKPSTVKSLIIWLLSAIRRSEYHPVLAFTAAVSISLMVVTVVPTLLLKQEIEPLTWLVSLTGFYH